VVEKAHKRVWVWVGGCVGMCGGGGGGGQKDPSPNLGVNTVFSGNGGGIGGGLGGLAPPPPLFPHPCMGMGI